jgi:hypothetical protein
MFKWCMLVVCLQVKHFYAAMYVQVRGNMQSTAGSAFATQAVGPTYVQHAADLQSVLRDGGSLAVPCRVLSGGS